MYFTEEDIPELFRSMLQCINLVTICDTKYFNHDTKIKKIFVPIVNDSNDLQSNGSIINTFNSQILFTFTNVTGDNLALHELRGFQRSFNSRSSSVDSKQARFTGDTKVVPAFPACSSLSDFFDCWWIVVVDQSCDAIRVF